MTAATGAPAGVSAPITTTVDAFLGGALLLTQPARGYRAGIDPLLLAAACPATAAERVLDCGAGIGTVGLCIARRLPHVTVTLVERVATYAALARANIATNDLAARVDLVESDLTAPLSRTPTLARMLGHFDHAVANPPYTNAAHGTPASDPLKDAANAMPAGDLEAWARFIAAMLRPGGTATLVHRADALPALLAALERRFGGLTIRPVHPRPDQPANRILLTATKGSRAPLTLLPPLIVHAVGGNYSSAVEAILRAPVALT